MEMVKKSVLGAYVTADKDTCTHLVLTTEEYDKLRKDLRHLQAQVDKLREDRKDALKKAKTAQADADRFLEEERENMQEAVKKAVVVKKQEYNQKIYKAKEEQIKAENLNVNLIRIMRERANAQRGIKPKKEHFGFVVLRSEQVDSKNQVVWRTTVQSFVNTSIPYEEARDLIMQYEAEIYEKLGLEQMVKQEYLIQERENRGLLDMLDAYQHNKQSLDPDSNYVYGVRYKQNFNTQLWEIAYSHLKPITVPADMLAKG